MASETFGIAQALKTAIETEFSAITWDILLTPHLLSQDADSNLKGYILASELDDNIQDARSIIKRDFRFLVILRTLSDETVAAIDPLVDEVEKILDWMNGLPIKPAAGFQYNIITAKATPIYEHEKLRDNGIFESIITVVFRIIRKAKR